MKFHINRADRPSPRPAYVNVGGLPVRLSDIRGFEMTSEESRTVILGNGMKVVVSSEEREALQEALSARATAIVQTARQTRVL